MIQLRFIYIMVSGLLTLQACTGQSADGGGATNQTSSIANDPEKKGWLYNMNDAQAQSVKANKPILVNFTNRDTCGLCKQLEANVFSTSLFKEWAENNVVLLELDFSKHNQLPDGTKEQNAGMAQALKVTSYPTVWMLSVTHEKENGRFKVKPIGKANYEQSPERFIGTLQNFVRR